MSYGETILRVQLRVTAWNFDSQRTGSGYIYLHYYNEFLVVLYVEKGFWSTYLEKNLVTS